MNSRYRYLIFLGQMSKFRHNFLVNLEFVLVIFVIWSMILVHECKFFPHFFYGQSWLVYFWSFTEI